MRQTILALSLLPALASAQVFQHVSVEQFSASDGQELQMAGLSRNGRYAFTTSPTRCGLVRIDLDNRERQVITNDLGAGINPIISPDGKTVRHSIDTFDENHIRHTEWKTVAPAPPRGEQQSLDSSTPRSVAPSSPSGEPAREVSINTSLRIELTIDGMTRTLAPNGDDEETNYLWASLSPDGTRILYFVSDEGAYVCNLDGEDLQFIAYDCQAPQWYDDQTIVGMRTRDDGEFIRESYLVAYTLQGDRQQLSQPSQMLMYPFCAAEAGRIVSANPKGELFILNVTR